MTLRKREVLEIKRGSTRPHSVENLLWKSLWDYEVNVGKIVPAHAMKADTGSRIMASLILNLDTGRRWGTRWQTGSSRVRFIGIFH
jgi:hypothetical protein